MDLSFPGQSGLQSKFQDRKDYSKKLCFEKPKMKKKNKIKNRTKKQRNKQTKPRHVFLVIQKDTAFQTLNLALDMCKALTG